MFLCVCVYISMVVYMLSIQEQRRVHKKPTATRKGIGNLERFLTVLGTTLLPEPSRSEYPFILQAVGKSRVGKSSSIRGEQMRP
jgi:hypothetical protein